MILKNYLLIFITVFVFSSLNAQLQPGFDTDEAIDMIAISNSFTFIKLYNSDAKIAPPNYKRVHNSGVYGLDNRFQIWRKNDVGVVVFRGSTTKKTSWLENMYSVMIPAIGTIVLPGSDTVDYKFAVHDSARVHSGWSLGLVFMIRDVLDQIELLKLRGVNSIIITGHSQGGALAHLCTAYINNIENIRKDFTIKTYAFASPMIGNEAFSSEYQKRYADQGLSFNIYNPKDMIPNMPVSVFGDGHNFYSFETLAKVLDPETKNPWKNLALTFVTKAATNDPVGAYMLLAGRDIHNQIVKALGPVGMPPYTKDVEYVSLEKRISIGPFDELEVLLDSTHIHQDSLFTATIQYRDSLNDLQGGSMHQHKPYNYYLYMLKIYRVSLYDEIITEEKRLWNTNISE